MKKITILFAAVVLLFGVSSMQSCKSSSKAAGSTMFKFNLEKGKGYDYELQWDLDTKVQGSATKVSITGLYSMLVSDVQGDVRSVTTSYKKIHMNMNVMGMEIDIDSDKPQGNDDTDPAKNPLGMMNKMISSLVDKPFVIKVNEEGKVLEVDGFEKIIEDMINTLTVDESAKAQARASMKDQFSEQNIKDQFAQVFYIFPNKEIKVGDTWEKSYSTGGKMAANNTTVFTVKSIEGDHVSLTTKTKIKSAGEQDLEGEQSGNVLVDSKTGLMINAEFDQDITVKAQGQNVTVTGKGKIKGKAH